jgi:hypothetical protein
MVSFCFYWALRNRLTWGVITAWSHHVPSRDDQFPCRVAVSERRIERGVCPDNLQAELVAEMSQLIVDRMTFR